MKINEKIFAYSIEQIAFPVGKEEDAYYIVSDFILIKSTNEVTVISEVIKNLYSNSRSVLHKGTYKECETFIRDLLEPL